MRELRRFVKLHGSEYGLPSMKIINSVLRSHTGLVRLYFDAVYQERKYGTTIDKETGEIVEK
ncbi:TPA: replication protein RepB, partial [Streptococcus agalactiae]